MRPPKTLLAALALCALASTGGADGYDVRISASNGAAAQAIAVTNANRRAAGLPALREDAALNRAARVQAAHIARLGRMTHSGPGGTGVLDRIRAAGMRACYAAENIGLGPWDGAGVAAAWLRSPGHRTNAFSTRGTRVGVAQVGQAWAMVFAEPC